MDLKELPIKKIGLIIGLLIAILSIAVISMAIRQKREISRALELKEKASQEMADRNKEINKLAGKTLPEKLEGFHFEPLAKTGCDAKEGKEKIDCLDYLVADKAEQSGDYKDCAPIKDDKIKSYCLMKFVRASNDTNMCALLDHEGKEECLNYIAFATRDPKLCESENEFDQKECLGPILAYNAATLGNPDECKKIDILEYSNLCFERMINNFDRNCTLFKDKADQVACEDIIMYEAAMDTDNADGCQLINDPIRKQVCVNALTKDKNVDTDGDGISDNKELWFTTHPFQADTDYDGLTDGEEMERTHTNPTDADTDSDGFSDGDEIKSGHDPKSK